MRRVCPKLRATCIIIVRRSWGQETNYEGKLEFFPRRSIGNFHLSRSIKMDNHRERNFDFLKYRELSRCGSNERLREMPWYEGPPEKSCNPQLVRHQRILFVSVPQLKLWVTFTQRWVWVTFTQRWVCFILSSVRALSDVHPTLGLSDVHPTLGLLHPVLCASRQLLDRKQRSSTVARECLAVVWSKTACATVDPTLLHYCPRTYKVQRYPPLWQLHSSFGQLVSCCFEPSQPTKDYIRAKHKLQSAQYQHRD